MIAPHSSFHQLVTANGHTAVVYNERTARLTSFREHAYAAVDHGVPVRELAKQACFGLRLDGVHTWLGDLDARARYLPGTGIVESLQRHGSIEATTYLFAPFELRAPAAVFLLRLTNSGRTLGEADAAFSRQELEPGRGVLHFAPFPAAIQTDSTTFRWSISGLDSGETIWLGFVFGYHPFGNTAAIERAIAEWIDARPASALLADELSRWSSWHRSTVLPPALSADERAVFLQQVALLRMGQVREPNDAQRGYLPHGQMLASLPPGKWNISWVRDGMVSVRALVRSGHLHEARDALAFVLDAKVGEYRRQVGLPYQVSVVRYFGGGREESDFNEDGPNIEWDGFGMFLDALDAYEFASGDLQLASERWESVTRRIADVLVHLGSNEGLLPADSSIWETHWENGARQHWTWSQVWGVVGLRAAASIASRHRQASLAESYARAAEKLHEAIVSQLVGADGFLVGRLESAPSLEDASVVEAFCRGVIDPLGDIAAATLARLQSRLRVASGRGFRRNQGPSEYDRREWIFVDLLMANALRLAGKGDEAEAIIGWITAQARANHDLIAENYDPVTADYAGAVPMIGFGAGAYLLSLFAREETS